MPAVNGKEILTSLEELADPRHTALLIIDLQNDHVSPGGYFDARGWAAGIRPIVPRVRKVLEAARTRGVLVVHVQMTLYPRFLAESPTFMRAMLRRAASEGITITDSVEKLAPYVIEGTWGWQIIDELAPLPGEVIIRKHRRSSFQDTDLGLILRSNGIRTLAIVGCATHGCVMATAYHVQGSDYYSVLLQDCVAGPDPTLHDAALLIMKRAHVVDYALDCDQVLNIWHRSAPFLSRQGQDVPGTGAWTEQ